MIADICYFENRKWHGIDSLRKSTADYQLLLIFGEKNNLMDPGTVESLSHLFSEATVVSCSSAGEIYHRRSKENSTLCIAISFNYTKLACTFNNISESENSFALGANAARALNKEQLKYVLVLSDGSLINGTDLIEGIVSELGQEVVITGGMAGDNNRFESTLVGLNNNIGHGNVVLVGFYGSRINIGFGNRGGFVNFGPERIVTKSEKNILYEIDGVKALELYKRYLGKFAADLPGSALYFPVGIINQNGGDPLVRTILSVDEEKQSMIFAGNIPMGSRFRLMRAPLDNLIAMAASASSEALEMSNPAPDLALVMNCVGRRIVLADRADDEIEAISKTFPEYTTVAGMYTYGEFCPHQVKNEGSFLHNQNVVVTLFYEN